LNVRFIFFQTFHSLNIEKITLVKQFIDSYPSALNNSQKTDIKKSFIELAQMFEEKGIIEINYKIISGSQFYPVDKLTIQNISEGFIIHGTFSI